MEKQKTDFMNDDSVLKSSIENFIIEKNPKKKLKLKFWYAIIKGGILTIGLHWVFFGIISIYIAICGIYINSVWIIEFFKNLIK